jgi:hypothetical protein
VLASELGPVGLCLCGGRRELAFLAGGGSTIYIGRARAARRPRRHPAVTGQCEGPGHAASQQPTRLRARSCLARPAPLEADAQARRIPAPATTRVACVLGARAIAVAVWPAACVAGDSDNDAPPRRASIIKPHGWVAQI